MVLDILLEKKVESFSLLNNRETFEFIHSNLTIIKIITYINAPIERCFDLSTSIDLHKISTSKTKEEAIAGVTNGLVKLNDKVTWKAKHFGIWHQLQVQITEYERPLFFVDEMIKGTFKSMRHRHEFKQIESGTIMVDQFEFSSPFGILGKIVDHFILKNYMTNFLKERNEVVKDFAESDKWKEVIL